jgi:hypothetical protein
VANLQVDIEKNRAKQTANLLDAKNGTNRTLKELAIDKKRIISETVKLRNKTSKDHDEIEKQKIEISIKGNESIIRSIEAQEKIWSMFYAAQEKLFPRLELNSKKIDLLLHVLKTNSSVYREAATVAKLRRSAKEALRNLQSLSKIHSILNDLQNSWIEVNDLVSEISNADFNINIQ